MTEVNTIYNENCLETMAKMPDGFIDCCVTSPPYWGLRDYGTATWEGGKENCDHVRNEKFGIYSSTLGGSQGQPSGDAIYKDLCGKCGAKRVDQQIGLEKTPEEFVSKLVEVFSEVRRVLKPEGTLWLNLGDSYWGGKGQSGQAWSTEHTDRETLHGKQHQISGMKETRPQDGKHAVIKPKDLVGIPWMTAFALRSSGWFLRQDIIWAKSNPMPESVTDRCTKSHEYIFLLSKSSRYYYDSEAIKEESVEVNWEARLERESLKSFPNEKANGIRTKSTFGNRDGELNGLHSGKQYTETGKRNKRSVWNISTKPFGEAHFATFPEDLIKPMILAGCPEGGIVYDPFMGAGTTGLVAHKLNRKFIGSELNAEYVAIANRRIAPYLNQQKLQFPTESAY